MKHLIQAGFIRICKKKKCEYVEWQPGPFYDAGWKHSSYSVHHNEPRFTDPVTGKVFNATKAAELIMQRQEEARRIAG